MTAVAAVTAAAVALWAAALSLCDARDRRLPNLLTLPGAVAILGGAALFGHGRPALAGALALVAVYLAVHLCSPTGMGAGDVKLALGLGALAGAAGPGPWILAALAAPLLTAVLGAAAALAGRGRTVPHGPSMCLATLAAVALAAH